MTPVSREAGTPLPATVAIVLPFSIFVYFHKTTCYPVLTDFPDVVMQAGAAAYGVTLQAGSRVTWIGATQTLTCQAANGDAELIAWEANCEVDRGCRFQQTATGGPSANESTMRFIAGSEWNNSFAICRIYTATKTSRGYVVPILVRALPVLYVTPSPADAYIGYPLMVRCRSDNPFVAPTDLMWSLRGDDGGDMVLDEKNHRIERDTSDMRLTLRPPEIARIRRIRCEAKLGAEAPYAYARAGAIVNIRNIPQLIITPESWTFPLAKNGELSCTGRGHVIGSLRWRVDCDRCRYSLSPPDATSKASSLLSSSAGSRATLAFVAGREWDGVTVSCTLADFERIAQVYIVRVKHLPVLSITPPTVDVYNSRNVTLVCRAKYEAAGNLRGERPLPTATTPMWLRWSVVTDEVLGVSSDEQALSPSGRLMFTIGRDRSGNMSFGTTVSFTASSAWHGQKIACALWTGYAGDAAATRRTAIVRVYNPPSLIIVPGNPLLEPGTNATLTCVVDGEAIGGLQWLVDCHDCGYLVASGSFPFGGTETKSKIAVTTAAAASAAAIKDGKQGKQRLQAASHRTLFFKATDSWHGARAECSVRGNGGWPSASVVVEVRGVYAMTAAQWTGVSLAMAAILALVVYIINTIVRHSQKQDPAYRISMLTSGYAYNVPSSATTTNRSGVTDAKKYSRAASVTRCSAVLGPGPSSAVPTIRMTNATSDKRQNLDRGQSDVLCVSVAKSSRVPETAESTVT